MLTLTPDAAHAIKTLLEAEQLPETGGMRIALVPVSESEHELAIILVGACGVHEEEVREHGARVFLDPAVADELADKSLDAVIEADTVRFAFVDAA